MITDNITPIAIFVAGIASIVSPCIFPLLPALFASSTDRGRFRPLAIVLGLCISFVLMGIITSAFGNALRDYLTYLNILAAAVIIGFGIVMVSNIEIFNIFSKIPVPAIANRGVAGGVLLGLSLGVLWLPCIGPILGAVLTRIAVEGNIYYGAAMLSIYSLGFAIPMLLVAYTAHFTGSLGNVAKYQNHIKKGAGLVLIIAGIWMLSINPFVTF
ncbi:MAG: cytochrome c biogenesis CcdA family protein [Methanohalophilus sp.]